MTHKRLENLKIELKTMQRVELVNNIWELSKDEFETFEDVLQLAKETDNQLKNRLYSVLSWFEYLAK
jgi:hypothetical protein